MTETISTERHPLLPFMPDGARLLMLGSFPPPRARWSMDFFYPNLQNDMWRIFGLILHNDRDAFVDTVARRFRLDEIIAMLTHLGIALYDTATEVRRLRGNASDNHLEVVLPTDVKEILHALPECRAVCTTGQKATETLCATFSCPVPALAGSVDFTLGERALTLYRMPSSSRAYPIKLADKAERYARMLHEIFGDIITKEII